MKNAKLQIAIFASLVWLIILPNVASIVTWAQQPNPVQYSQYMRYHEGDDNVILTSVATHSPWHYVTHTWCGAFGYYRPLSSIAFWLEYHALGAEHFNWFMIINLVSNLVTLFALGYLAFTVSKSIIVAGLTPLLFTYGCPMLHLDPGAAYALHRWVDLPEFWCATGVFMTLAAFYNRKWWQSIAWFAVAALFKEQAFLVLPLLLFIAASKRYWKRIPTSAYIAFGLVVTLIVMMKAYAGMNFGERISGHNYWQVRYLSTVAGWWLNQARSHVETFWLAIGIVSCCRVSVEYKAYTTVVLISTAARLLNVSTGCDYLVAFVALFPTDFIAECLPMFVFGAFAAWSVRKFWNKQDLRLSILAYVVFCAVVIPTCKITDQHTMYTAYVFLALFVAQLVRHVAASLENRALGYPPA